MSGASAKAAIGALWVIGAVCLFAAERSESMTVPPLGESGTISFRMQTDQTYRNGQGQENYQQTLIRLPGIFEISFSRTDPSVNLR